MIEFSQELSVWRADRRDGMRDVVLLTMSEFGCTARENGNRETDHGQANVMFCPG